MTVMGNEREKGGALRRGKGLGVFVASLGAMGQVLGMSSMADVRSACV